MAAGRSRAGTHAGSDPGPGRGDGSELYALKGGTRRKSPGGPGLFVLVLVRHLPWRTTGESQIIRKGLVWVHPQWLLPKHPLHHLKNRGLE